MVELFLNGFDIERVTSHAFDIVLYMIVFDILTGGLLAGKERKLNSSINLDGLFRKLGIVTGLAFVTVIDVYLQTNGTIVKIAVGLIIAYESLSIIENLSKLGVNFRFLTKYFDPEKVGKKDD